MRKFFIIISLCLCFSLLGYFVPAFADSQAVTASSDGAVGGDALYVAGDPDFYPVEGYDTGSGGYKGACPAFLQLVSERTGLKFVYIRAGEQDRREDLSRNLQVELLFAASDEEAVLETADDMVRLFTVLKNGEAVDIYCLFTSVIREDDRAAIKAAAESLTKDDVSGLFTLNTEHALGRRRLSEPVAALSAALLIAVAAAAVLSVLLFRKTRRSSIYTDAVTKIGNRAYFFKTFYSVISDQEKELYYIVCFSFNISRVNIDYGPDESDNILRHAADAVARSMKDREFCARIDGGSFAAAICCSNIGEAELRIGEILSVLNAYRGKYGNGETGMLFRAGACSLASYAKSIDEAIFNVDLAYERAVKENRSVVFACSDVLNERKKMLSIREQAEEAVRKKAFTPYVQFIICTADGSICGGELLSRWQNPLYGLLSPGAYVPILQDMGLIGAHDLLMLDEACRLLQEWHERGRTWFLTCNITRITISNEQFIDRALEITSGYSFAKERLVLEITEDTIEVNKELALKNIARIRGAGFCIGLDDFTGGYTTFANLYEYSADIVKLDRHMVSGAENDRQAAVLMTEIVKMCHDLNMRVLIEGVENEAQKLCAFESGCDYIQGYYYSKPLPLRELEDFTERYNRLHGLRHLDDLTVRDAADKS